MNVKMLCVLVISLEFYGECEIELKKKKKKIHCWSKV